MSLLGEGGFGYVYEVENALTGEKYALKRMSCSDKTVLENIKKEIEVWNKINNCPNIVKLIDYEFSNQFVSILMELCTGNLLITKLYSIYSAEAYITIILLIKHSLRKFIIF